MLLRKWIRKTEQMFFFLKKKTPDYESLRFGV